MMQVDVKTVHTEHEHRNEKYLFEYEIPNFPFVEIEPALIVDYSV